MNEEIGAAAGQVWQALADKGELSVVQLKKATGLDAPLLDWAVGWLAREDKLALVSEPGKKGSFRLQLK